MSISVEFVGVEAAMAVFQSISPRVAMRVKAVVAETALNVQKQARRNCPVDTGRLRASIRPRFWKEGLAADVFTDVHYAVHQEFGTRHMAAQPFLFPAWEAEQPNYQAALRAALQDLA